MNTRLIIFDLDGTLLDTIDDLAAACNHALGQCGCPVRERDEYYMLVGRGISNLFRGALPEGMKTDEMVEKMRSQFLPYYNAHSADLTKPYEGIIPMLESLKSKGIALAVASNKFQAGTEALIERFFGGFDFVRILGQREGKPIKPDPAIVHEAMEGVPGIGLDEVVYCGDSDVDMMTGANAGVRTIGVKWGFRTENELMRHNPWLLVERPEEIAEAVS
jgi:phosphoglycolate phosphatase